ncbi:MAG: response regulator [Acidobacteria bacterium]|nr:response regulator [Acidobacteriota bacterium]
MASILLVEDDQDQLAIRCMILRRSGHTVYSAISAQSALESLRTIEIDCVIMDLRLPTAQDGVDLIRSIRAFKPTLPIVVLSGWTADLAQRPEHGMVNAILAKPVRTEHLLKIVGRFVACLCMLAVLARSALAQSREFPFTVQQRGEVVAELRLAAPGADWAAAGREAALAELSLDGKPQQHLMAFAGERVYGVFLGQIEPGPHVLKVERHRSLSAAGAALAILGARIVETRDERVLHAPILYARANTIGAFSDVPLLVYSTSGRDQDGRWLEYSVIFSNEDGGTSTRDLMARWGRTTDIEYVYRVWLDARGAPAKTLIQTRDHKDVPYAGAREGLHPILIPVTDNNMVEPAGAGASPIRYQLIPVPAELSSASREAVMDVAPLTYEISAKELIREGKLRDFGKFDGEKISDPRNYLIVELKLQNQAAALQVLARKSGSSRWQASALGLGKDHIERNGWARTTIEMPPGTNLAGIAEIAVECLSLRDLSKQLQPKNGRCLVESIGKIFFLGPDYVPQPAAMSPAGPWKLEVGEMVTLPLR